MVMVSLRLGHEKNGRSTEICVADDPHFNDGIWFDSVLHLSRFTKGRVEQGKDKSMTAGHGGLGFHR